jgi:Fungal trichothecene efflux pump (TRI12)
MMTAGIAALSTVNQNTPGRGMGLSFLAGFGVGGLLLPAATILTIISPDELIATITSATISVRQVGCSVGFAIYFNVLQNKLAQILAPNVAAAAAEAGLPPNQIPTFLEQFLGGNTTAIASYSASVLLAAGEAVKDSYVEGFRLVYLVGISFGGTAIIACLFLGDIKKYMVDRVAVDIH